MLKKTMKLFLLFGVLIFSLICVSCKNSNSTPEEMIIEVYRDHFKSYYGYKIDKQDVKIKYYLGQYGDAHCAYIEGDKPNSILVMYPCRVTIDGETFEFKNIPEIISVYYNNKYYGLITACDEGILTLEDVKALHEYCTKYVY